MASKEKLTIESDRRQSIVRRINHSLVRLQESLSGLLREKLDYKDLRETDHYRLGIIKGMSNYDLDIQTFQVWRSYNYISDYLEKLRTELDKRAKYSLIPTDGSDWEPASNGRPSIGPRIDTTKVSEEEETKYV